MLKCNLLSAHTLLLFTGCVISTASVFAEKSDGAPRKIAVFGSSVAHGSVDHQGKGGYAGRLHDLLAPRGWEVVNVSRGGDNTNTIAPRFETDLIPQHPGYVIIGLSLSNEGIAKQPDKEYRDRIFDQWRTGIQALMKRCRDAGMFVIIGGCYARNSFSKDPQLYEYTRRMNLEISRFDAPSINFLGAIDSGAGGWAEHFEANDGHPNGAGHQEMFLAIVPSLFEALEAHKPIPTKEPATTHAYQKGGDGAAPMLFTPDDVMHSFAVSFWIKPLADGTLAVVTGKDAAIKKEMTRGDDKGVEAYMIETGSNAISLKLGFQHDQLVYEVSPKGTGTIGNGPFEGGRFEKDTWHHVVVSHWCARGETQVYLDGELLCKTNERFIPEKFYLCGGNLPGTNAQAHYKEWCVYRSALNADQVRYLYDGNLYQSSLEVFAPLADSSFAQGATPENRAQSMSKVQILNNTLGVTPD